MKAYKAIIFYLALIGFIAYGIGQVKNSLPLIRQELGIIENQIEAIDHAINK